MTSTETNINTTLNTTEPTLTGPLKTLKDAFPDLDIEIIETIYETQGHNLDAAFEVLLNMSDPDYKPDPSDQFDQLRQDEEYARQLAREAQYHPQQQQQQRQQQQQEEEPLFNFQEELPIIKEKVIEAGTAAKNKIVGLYNQFMAANRSDGPSNTRFGSVAMNNNYYDQTGNMQQQRQQQQQQQQQQDRGSVDLYEWDGQHHNPLLSTTPPKKEVLTSTSEAQLLADEEFARQLAREEHEIPTTTREPVIEPFHVSSEVNDDNSTNHEEVTFTTPTPISSSNNNKTKEINSRSKPNQVDEEDDLDDLFDKKVDLNDDTEKTK